MYAAFASVYDRLMADVDYTAWAAFYHALMERYGADEVVTWPVEVWNEPNLPGFWYKADMQEYFKLFQKSENNDLFIKDNMISCGLR